jgi:glycosyltransferase involved in cell wall biosynthesis
MQNFYIIVPAYNAEKWIRNCIVSIELQHYKNYSIVLIDDCSEDGTWEIMKEFPYPKIRNEVHSGSVVENMVKVFSLYPPAPDCVDMVVDGDDYLDNRRVFDILNEAYKEDVWFTYGQFRPLSKAYENFCQPILNTDTYRKNEEWTIGQLRTWKHWLWEKVKDEDLRNDNGNYFIASCDRSFSYPMIEMSGPEHIRLIKEVLYVYNDLNPLCGFRAFPEECQLRANIIKSKQEYKKI